MSCAALVHIHGFCLLIERIQLLAHKFGLDFNDVFQILRQTKFLYKSHGSGNAFSVA